MSRFNSVNDFLRFVSWQRVTVPHQHDREGLARAGTLHVVADHQSPG